MEAAYDSKWVNTMAETLVCEIIELMSGIKLQDNPSWIQEVKGRKLDAIHGFVDGDYQIELRFLAEPRMFSRLARNMIGSEPRADEVQEYAMEFFNVVCGRFVSELYKVTHTSARFFPTRYEAAPDVKDLRGKVPLNTVYFISDQQELAAFSWTATPIEDLLRRSMHVKA